MYIHGDNLTSFSFFKKNCLTLNANRVLPKPSTREHEADFTPNGPHRGELAVEAVRVQRPRDDGDILSNRKNKQTWVGTFYT